MKLTDDRIAGVLLVRGYAPGEVRVGDTVLRRSCLLKPDRLVSDWRPQAIEEITRTDLDSVFALQPELVVIGSGTRQRFPDAWLTAAILERGIGCEVMDTGAACRTYNVLATEGRAVVAALLVDTQGLAGG